MPLKSSDDTVEMRLEEGLFSTVVMAFTRCATREFFQFMTGLLVNKPADLLEKISS